MSRHFRIAKTASKMTGSLLSGLWAIHHAQEDGIQAALLTNQFKPYLAGYPEISVPTAAIAAVDYTPEGYWADRLSIGPKGEVAVIPIQGTMTRGYSYDNYFSNAFLIRMLANIADNDAKKGVILDYNSGGGTVDSTDELAAAVAYLKEKKPVVALVSLCASAAYWTAAPCNEIIMRPGPTAAIGSIGTMYIHANYAKQLEQQGVDVQIFRSTGSSDKNKPNSIEPLDEATIAGIQKSLDVSNKVFKGAVRAGRGDKIKSDEVFTGKVYGAADAIRLGLADRLGDTQTAFQKVISISKNYV